MPDPGGAGLAALRLKEGPSFALIESRPSRANGSYVSPLLRPGVKRLNLPVPARREKECDGA
jgi:hypothetical protein